MTEHLLVESQGPWAGPGCEHLLRDATALAGAGHLTRVFLVQDGVLAAVPGLAPAVEGLLTNGGELWVDEFSCAQRGLSGARLVPSARLTDMDEVAGRMLEPAVKVVWH